MIAAVFMEIGIAAPDENAAKNRPSRRRLSF
jgi:hypothetical protein